MSTPKSDAARLLGALGGQERAKRLSRKRRQEIAKAGGLAAAQKKRLAKGLAS